MNNHDAESTKKLIYVIVCIIVIVYKVFPVDLIPDVIPLGGSIDDTLIALLPMVMGYRNIKKE